MPAAQVRVLFPRTVGAGLSRCLVDRSDSLFRRVLHYPVRPFSRD